MKLPLVRRERCDKADSERRRNNRASRTPMTVEISIPAFLTFVVLTAKWRKQMAGRQTLDSKLPHTWIEKSCRLWLIYAGRNLLWWSSGVQILLYERGSSIMLHTDKAAVKTENRRAPSLAAHVSLCFDRRLKPERVRAAGPREHNCSPFKTQSMVSRGQIAIHHTSPFLSVLSLADLKDHFNVVSHKTYETMIVGTNAKGSLWLPLLITSPNYRNAEHNQNSEHKLNNGAPH